MINNLKKEYERRYQPMLISNKGTEEKMLPEEVLSLWNAYDQLPEVTRKRVISSDVSEKIVSLQSKLSLPDTSIGQYTLLIRKKFFEDVNDQEFEKQLHELITQDGMEQRVHLEDIVSFFHSEIFSLDVKESVPEEEIDEEVEEIMPQKESQKMALLQALSKYPNLGNQMISQERIRVKSQAEPVRGSLYNWIKYYRDELGIGQHSTVERGQFLFRSENGKKLTSVERERVNLILKSIEENLSLDIDTEKQMIIFPVVATVISNEPIKEEKKVAEYSAVDRTEPAASSLSDYDLTTTPVTPAEIPSAVPPKPFTPQPAPARVVTEESVSKKFQPSQSPYEKIVIPNQEITGDAPLPSGIDVSNAAEKLKREPKPEWIKGAFTEESIPNKVKAEPVNGAMSFSLNHMLPVEQEVAESKPLPELKMQTKVTQAEEVIAPKKTDEELVPKKPTPKTSPRRPMSQFHIRPVSRGDDN